MNTLSFSLVLFSAFFHALWNFYTKKCPANKIATLWVGWLIAGAIFLPFAIYDTDFSTFSYSWLPFIIVTAILHALYLLLLGWSYSIGEMSLVYPLARGIGILGTLTISLAFGLDAVSNNGLIAIGLLVAGVMLIGMKNSRVLEKRTAVIAALSVGLCVALYSVVDNDGVKLVPPIFYITTMFILSPLMLLPFMASRLKAQTIAVWKGYKYYSAMIGIVSLMTYFLILWAFQSSPAPYVVALREVSIVIASILGICLLGEERNKRKLAGILLVLVGVIFLKVA